MKNGKIGRSKCDGRPGLWPPVYPRRLVGSDPAGGLVGRDLVLAELRVARVLLVGVVQLADHLLARGVAHLDLADARAHEAERAEPGEDERGRAGGAGDDRQGGLEQRDAAQAGEEAALE